MKKVIFLCLAFIAFASASRLSAQDIQSLKRTGNHLFKLEHYRNALPFFEKVLEKDSLNSEILFKAGVCYLHKYSKEKALALMLKAISLDPNVGSGYNGGFTPRTIAASALMGKLTLKHGVYWLGRAYHQNYMFDKALECYNAYKGEFSKMDERRLEIEKYIRQAEFARRSVAAPKNYLVKNLGNNINTIYSEHSPVTSANDDLILFTSRRNDVTGGKEDLDGEYFEDVFQSKRQGDSEWGKPESIGLNTSGHDGSIQMLDDKKLLVYRNSHGGDIYETERENGVWKTPVKFSQINTADFESDAFITADGKMAFFATNHYKKKGDLDIYYMVREENGSWGSPKDIPGNINTNEDDDAPVVTADGKTLYFSSRGHDNMGGYDIFKCTLQSDGTWSDPQNLGHPINTPDDDVYFYLASDGYRAYFSSYREGGYGEKDLYEIIPIPVVTITGEVVSENSGKPVPNTEIIFVPSRSSSEVKGDKAIKDGKYSQQIQSYEDYNVFVLKGKDTLYNGKMSVEMVKGEGQTITRDFKVKYNDEVIKPVVPDTLPKKEIVQFNRVYFATNSSIINAEGKAELEKAVAILKRNPNMVVEIQGNADDDGDAAFNTKLSEERSKKVLNYLEGKGIKSSRLKIRAMGESNPAAENDSEEGKQKNRRVEIIILKD